jgi:hypothetical protein
VPQHESEISALRRPAAAPHRRHFIALLVTSSVQIPFGVLGVYALLIAFWTLEPFMGSVPDIPDISHYLMLIGMFWTLFNFLLSAVTLVGCCILTGWHLVQTWTGPRQV